MYGICIIYDILYRVSVGILIKKIIFIFVAFLVLNISSDINSNSIYYNKLDMLYGYIDNFVENKYIKLLYLHNINKYSLKYNLDHMVIAKQIKAESYFVWWRVSKVNAIGCMQVRTKFWAHLLYKHKELSYAIKNSDDYKKYLMRIGYNISCGTFILRHYLNRFGSYPLALVAYCYGPGSDEFKTCKTNYKYLLNNKYVKKILY